MKSGENIVEDLPSSFAENLRVIAEGDASAFKFLLTTSACISCCFPFMCLYFDSLFFISLLYFQNNVSTLSQPVFSLVFLRSELVRKPIFGMGVLEMNLKVHVLCLCFFSFRFLSSLSLSNQPLFFGAPLFI